MLKHLLVAGALMGAVGTPVSAEIPDKRLEERVIVVGDRARSGPIEIRYSTDLTAVKAIIRAGGYGDLARTPVYLVRGGEVTRVDTKAAIELGQHDKDVALKPWDIIVIGFRVSQWR